MTKQQYKICICAVLVFVSLYAVSAQTQPNSLWRLSDSEGEIIIIVDGRRTVYPNGLNAELGVLLDTGDMVQTGKGAAELQFLTGDAAAVKLSENTSVVIGGNDDEVSLELLYGRIRLQSNTGISVKAGNSFSNFRECNAELFYAARQGFPQPAFIIKCFSGDGELIVNSVSEADGAKFSVKGGEVLSLEYRTPFFYVERKSLETISGQEEGETLEEHYWEPADADEQPAVSEGVPSEFLRESIEHITNNGNGNSARIKKGNLITGFILIGAGAAMQSYCYFGNPGSRIKDTLFYGSFGSMGLGAVFLLGAAAYGYSSGK